MLSLFFIPAKQPWFLHKEAVFLFYRVKRKSTVCFDQPCFFANARITSTSTCTLFFGMAL